MEFHRCDVATGTRPVIVCGDEVIEWVMGESVCTANSVPTAIGWKSGGQLSAGMVYERYTGPSVDIHLRIDSSKVLSRKWLQAVFAYPFRELGCKRVTGLISSGNFNIIRIAPKLDGELEAVLKEYFHDGDGLVYVIWRDKCRWLKGV